MASRPYDLPLGIFDAVQVLNHSNRGRTALRNLITLLNDGANDLDAPGKTAIVRILAAALHRPETILDHIRQTLDT